MPNSAITAKLAVSDEEKTGFRNQIELIRIAFTLRGGRGLNRQNDVAR